MALLAIGVGGCATHAQRLASIRDAYYADDTTAAMSLVNREIKRDRSDVDVLKLDRAIVDLVSGRPADAESTLREVRDEFDYLTQKDVGEAAFSYLTDDNHRAYAGEDYERILIRCFLCLSNLMNGGMDSQAYALQIGDQQRLILQSEAYAESKPDTPPFKRVALGAYINAALTEGTHRNHDEVVRSIQMVAAWEPDFTFIKDDLERVTTGGHSDRGHGVVYIFTLTGRGPTKEERSEHASSAALLIADRILSATSKHSLPPTIAPVKVPVVVTRPNRIQHVGVLVDGRRMGRTETITDVSQLAVEQYEAVFPRVMARAVVRRVVKKGAIYATKEFAGADQPLASLALDLAGIAWEATESADTRCWGLLPDQIQVLRLELPVGEHNISLAAEDRSRRIGPAAMSTVTVEDGRNTYLLAGFPDDELVGEILTSHGPRE